MSKEQLQEQEPETQSDIDLDSATAEISSELFGQGNEEDGESPAEGEGEESSGEHDADAAASPPQQETGETAPEGEQTAENSQEVQDVGAPKTWTKEALAEWASVPPRAQEEILKREQDFLNGIQMYKGAADLGVRYSEVVEPYMPVLEAEGLDPVQMFQSFAANHYILAKGRPEQKIELAAALLDGYQIPLPDLLNYMADRLDQEPANPHIQALEAKIARVEQAFDNINKQTTTASAEAISREIDAFAADPAPPYFNEVAADIQRLFEAGLATSLTEAYEKAVYANPVTRQKEIDRLTAEARTSAQTEEQTRKDKKARATADQVTITPKNRDGTVPTGSIDDTLSETMAAIEARG